MANKVDDITNTLEGLSISSSSSSSSSSLSLNEKQQLKLLRAAINVEKKGGDARNLLIYLQENSIGVCLNNSLLKCSQILRDAIENEIKNVNESEDISLDEAITCWSKMLDFIREHYYLLDDENQQELNKNHQIEIIIKVANENGKWSDEKKKNQFRNFITNHRRCRTSSKEFKKAISNANTLEEAFDEFTRIFIDSELGDKKATEQIIEEARPEMRGLENIGQFLHIVKSKVLKLREDTIAEERINDIKALLKEIPNLLDLQDIILKNGGIFVSEWYGKETDDADKINQENDNDFMLKSCKIKTIKKSHTTIKSLPDIGLIYSKSIEIINTSLLK